MDSDLREFENDVNQYGYLTRARAVTRHSVFENDVNQYGYLTCVSTATPSR